MKNTMLTALWMFGFFLVGVCLLIGFALLLQRHLFADNHWWVVPLTLTIAFGLGPICLPLLALKLCRRGKLPGTQSGKDLVHS
jgi:hypothetical protein